MEIEQTTNLFWTGGWDSTFRLLQLLLIEKKQVRPYYIIDPDRKSADIEIKTMGEIKKHLFSKYPQSKNLLLSTVYTHFDDIKPDEQIFKAWREIRNDRHIGAQYKWMAAFCKQYNISSIELSYENATSDKSVGSSITFHLNSSDKSEHYQTIFRFFSIQLSDISKKEMELFAKEQNWTSILHMTWFCHRPLSLPFVGSVPCGGCNPCIITVEEGFERRVPFYSRLFGRLAKKIYNSAVFRNLRKS